VRAKAALHADVPLLDAIATQASSYMGGLQAQPNLTPNPTPAPDPNPNPSYPNPAPNPNPNLSYMGGLQAQLLAQLSGPSHRAAAPVA
jgi:hypothetical protein